MGNIQNKTYTAPDGSVYRVEDDGSITKIKGGKVQSNEPPSKYQITPDGQIYRVESDGSVTYLGNAEERYSTENKVQSAPNLHIVAIKTTEEAAQEEIFLREELKRGKEIDFSKCNELLDVVDDFELWKTIVKNHISQPNIPPVNFLHNSSTRTEEFYDMIRRIVILCVSTDPDWNPWGMLPYQYLSNIINDTNNIDALNCIDCMDEYEIEYTEYDKQLFSNIKLFAKNRERSLATNAATANQEQSLNKKKPEGGCLSTILLFLVSVITISLIFINISAIS